jgi:predicted nucleotidyltransferase
LDAIVRQLVDLGALRIILFGSFVDGEVDVHSDLDFLVIMPSSKSGKEWSKAVYDAVERGAAAGIIAYNQVEFEEALPTSSFLERVVNSGRVVYEKAVQG